MNWWQRILIFAGAGHLLLVCLGTARVQLKSLPILGSPLHIYSAYTGADRQFGFFAPNVGSQLRAVFDLVDGNGNSVQAELPPGASRESNLRIQNIVSLLWDQVDNETLRRTMSASLAAKMFTRFPGTKQVTVRFEGYELPPMSQFASGDRPYWKHFYRARFVNEVGE